jgi:hypothetical protein
LLWVTTWILEYHLQIFDINYCLNFIKLPIYMCVWFYHFNLSKLEAMHQNHPPYTSKNVLKSPYSNSKKNLRQKVTWNLIYYEYFSHNDYNVFSSAVFNCLHASTWAMLQALTNYSSSSFQLRFCYRFQWK